MDTSRRRNLILVGLIGFTFFSAFGLFTLLPLHLEDFGVSPGQIGVMLSALFLSSMVLRPLLGGVAPRIGSRRLALMATSLWVIITPFYFVLSADNLWLVYLLRIVQGAAMACMDLVVSVVPQQLMPAGKRAQGFGRISVLFVLGWSASPGLAAWILERWGFSVVIGLSTCLAGVAMLGALALRLPPGRMPAARFHVRDMAGAWKRTLSRDFVFLLLAAGIAMGVVSGSYNNFVPLYAESRGVGAGASFFLSMSIASVVSRAFLAGLSDRWGRWQVVALSLAIGIGAQVLLFDVRSGLFIALAGMIYGLQSGLQTPAAITLATEIHEGDSNPALAMGLFFTAFDAGIWLGASTFGFLSEAVGYGPAFLSLAVANGLGIALVLLGIRAAAGAPKRGEVAAGEDEGALAEGPRHA